MVLGPQASCPARVQAFTPVVWCLPEYSSGCSCHDQQGVKGAVDYVLKLWVEDLPAEVSTLEGVRRSKGCRP